MSSFKSIGYVLVVAFAILGIGLTLYQTQQSLFLSKECIQDSSSIVKSQYGIMKEKALVEEFKNQTQDNLIPPPQTFPPRPGYQSEMFPPPCPQDDTSKISLIYTRGERHHGTHWVKEIINRNSLGPHVTEPDYLFWKHGFLDGYNYKLNDDKLLVVLTRDIFTWLPKMYGESYCKNRHGKSFPRVKATKPFSQWMRTFYNCEDALGWLDREAANIIALRTSKYKSWLVDNPDYFNYDPPYCKRVHLRYEAIMDDQEGTIGAMLKHYDIPMNSPSFQPVLGYTKWSTPRVGEYHEPDRIQILREYYSIDDLQWIMNNLDLDFEENILGYNYDYVRQYIKDNRK